MHTELDTPMVVVGGWGRHVYYKLLDHVPDPEEYFHAGREISEKMLSQIGQMPQRWKLLPQEEFDVDVVAEVMRKDPVRV